MSLRDGAARQRLGRRFAVTGLLAAVVLAATPAAARAELETVAGVTEGALSVDDSGNAVYTLPIAVPPGVAGIQPDLSLNYDSQSGNGLLGVGWSLGGLSVIHRCAKNIAQDGVIAIGGIGLNADDRFCLDGQRLVAVSGTYGADGAEYRTEIDGFSRIISHGTSGNGPRSFTVETKLGRILSYGNTADSRLEADGAATVRHWAIDEVADRLGNTMTFHYDDDTVEKTFKIERIAYGGNDSTGTQPSSEVRFLYEARPDRRSNYQVGSLLNLTKLLKVIEVRTDGAVVRTYRLGYGAAPSEATGRPILSSVRECSGQGKCLVPITFGTSISQIGFGASDIWKDGASEAEDEHKAFHDVNGDGLLDYVGHSANRSGTKVVVALNTGGEFGPRRTWMQTTANWSQWPASFQDMNGDGLPDLVRHFSAAEGSQVWVWQNTGSEFGQGIMWASSYADWSGWSSSFHDVNGDGLLDYIGHSANRSGTKVVVALNTGGEFGPRRTWMQTTANWSQWPASFQDMNGDGLPDLVRHFSAAEGSQVWVWQNTGSEFEQGIMWASSYADWSGWSSSFHDVNGDGLLDYVGHSANRSGTKVVVALNTGGEFGPRRTWMQTTVNWSQWPASFQDMNGDGLPDLVRHFSAAEGSRVWVWQNTGSEFGQGIMWTSSYADWSGWSSSFHDVNGDALPDLIRYQTSGRAQVSLNNGALELLTSVTDSLGHATAIDYAPLTDPSVYTKGTDAAFPVLDLQGPLYVVKEVSAEDGLGGQARTTYSYEGAKVDLQGRGFLGFTYMTAVDEQTGIETVTRYHQHFPFIGAVADRNTRLADGTRVQAEGNTWTEKPLNGGLTTFPYVSSTRSASFEINDGPGNRYVTKATTTRSFDDFGNPTEISTTTNGQANGVFTETTINSYDNDSANWLLGRLRRSEVTRTLPDLSSDTRVSSFGYHPTTGLLLQEVVEPDLPAFKLATDYGYDAYGNVTSTTVSGPDIATRTTTVGFSDDGRFATGATNALGHVETRAYDARFGAVASLTGPNGITTTWDYDGFGRKTKEIRADGTETTWSYELCAAQCPPGGVYAVVQQDLNTASQTPIGPRSVVYFDELDRGFRSETEGFDGTRVFTDTTFDARGRTVAVTRPYFEGSAAADIRKVTTTYDVLGRPLTVTQPDGGVTTTSYDGLTSSSTNALGQTQTRRVDVIGRPVEVIDNLGTAVTYSHDPFGNLLETDAGGVVTTMAYDIRGRKTSMDDPDMGIWFYEHNALGELVRQTDAKGQSAEMDYDLLGRLVQRVEAEGTTGWTYDSAAKGIGKLQSVSAPEGYLQVQSYDGLGRPSATTTTIDGVNYTSGVTYDTSGRVETRSYPSGFTVRKAYNARGYLASVSDGGGSTVFWRAESVNAEGQVTRESFGNGVETLSAYDPETGLIDTLATRLGTAVVQDLDYDFDRLGNLKRRADLRQGREESFSYDGLNRVTATTLTGSGAGTLATTSYTYDSLGNIETKSDVGTYVYGGAGAGPHAVTEAGGETYAYDANGNMTSGAGRSIAWSSFNKPTLIREDATGNEAGFTYGPGRARIKQHSVRNNLARDVVYLGGYERRMRFGSPDELVHYISAGDTVAIYTVYDDNLPATDKTRYLHRDHLGSVETITGESGAVVERLSYDAHGKRRLADWQAGTPASPDAETPRGFTGHEHLDGVGLIHMNGRVYDPTLGRFLSADPYVQAPGSSQSFNRYSYAGNNPLSYTDPSGFFFNKLKRAFKKVVRSVSRAVRAVGRGVRRALQNRWVQMAGQIVANVILPGVGGAIFAGVTTLANGGNVMDAIGAAGLSLVSGAAYSGLGEAFRALPAGFNPVTAGLLKTAAHGVVGGAFSVARGGTFRQGFASSAVAAIAGPSINGLPSLSLRKAAASALAGGAAAHLGGGKFADGAKTGAFRSVVRDYAGYLKEKDGRPLTADMIKLARTVFKDSIDYSKVTVYNRRYIFGQPTDTLLAPDGNLYYPKGSPHYPINMDGSDASLTSQLYFIHEMGHVWQHQQGVAVGFRGFFENLLNPDFEGDPFRGVGWNELPASFDRLSIEQQADAASYYFILLQKQPNSNLTQRYKDYLPFSR